MSEEERKKILEMLAEGKLDVSEAEKLLDAIGDKAGSESITGTPEIGKKYPKYLVIMVKGNHNESGKHGNVNIRVPFQLLRAGIKLASLIPVAAKGKINDALSQHGMEFNVDSLKPENFQEIINALQDMTIDVEDGKETVRVYCE